MLKIRPATRADIPLILQFIRELAEYERAPSEVETTEADLLRDGFGEPPRYRAVIAEWNGEPAGFAFFFNNYSTWRGHQGLYLEDLFVRPQFRGKGIGKALLAHLAAIAVKEDCYGMRWAVLDWNQPAIDFYLSLGGTFLREWLIVRLDGEPLQRLAKEAP
ncbi:MAG: GNAT family N-acetyltransferase [Acidobacteriales bacterium]|nr:GNAT family N-acetyltransferase [Terriglobales bacterium]